MFQPPRCPRRACPRHRDPRPGFFHRHGFYAARCRPRLVPRYRCTTCGGTFSRQTFRMDYRDHRPQLNPTLFLLMTSGVGLRQSSRVLGLSLRCTELKARKIARHLRRLNANLLSDMPEGTRLQFDELETYEGRRNTRPLSLSIMIEPRSRYVLWAESAPIRPKGKMPKSRLKAIREDEARFGKRVDRSMRSVWRTFRRAAKAVKNLGEVVLSSDEKSSYVGLAKRAFGKKRLVHTRTNSKLARMTWNPLFPINHTEAMARDQTGRLRRESWLVSKKRRYLDIGIHAFIAYRNLVRRRFNYDTASPAEMLGILPRRLTPGEVLSWRQDGGVLSIHPLATRGQSVAEWRAA